MVDLVPLLYLDFGFLEQKMRATGLPNTIGDLQMYRKEIIGESLIIIDIDIINSFKMPINKLNKPEQTTYS